MRVALYLKYQGIFVVSFLSCYDTLYFPITYGSWFFGWQALKAQKKKDRLSPSPRLVLKFLFLFSFYKQ